MQDIYKPKVGEKHIANKTILEIKEIKGSFCVCKYYNTQTKKTGISVFGASFFQEKTKI